MTWYYWIVGIFAIGIMWVIYEWITAPEGFEDKNGFHYGQRRVRPGGEMDVTNRERNETEG